MVNLFTRRHLREAGGRFARHCLATLRASLTGPMKARRRSGSRDPDGKQVLHNHRVDIRSCARSIAALAKIAHALGGHSALMFVPDLNADGFWTAPGIEPTIMAAEACSA